MDYSPPGSSVHGILQARILEWVATPLQEILTQGSNLSLLWLLHCKQILTTELLDNNILCNSLILFTLSGPLRRVSPHHTLLGSKLLTGQHTAAAQQVY